MSNRGELARRVGVAAVGIPVALGLGYWGGIPLAAFLGLLGALGAQEFCSIHRTQGVAASAPLAALLALVYVLLGAAVPPDRYLVWAIVAFLAVGATVMLTAPSVEEPVRKTVITVFAGLYTGLPLACAVWLRELGGDRQIAGATILFLPVAVTWLGDTAAYFIGHAVGRHKLAPTISPGKTWEGAVAGFAATIGGALLYVHITRPLVTWTLELTSLLIFAGLVAVAGQIGDLFESRVKRACGVKDSSSLLPGHGGVLDRLDSLLFVFPVAYAHLLLAGV